MPFHSEPRFRFCVRGDRAGVGWFYTSNEYSTNGELALWLCESCAEELAEFHPEGIWLWQHET